MEKDAIHDNFSSPFSKMTKQSKSLGLNFGRGTMFKKGGKGVEGVRKRKGQAEGILMLKTSYQTSNRDFQY